MPSSHLPGSSPPQPVSGPRRSASRQHPSVIGTVGKEYVSSQSFRIIVIIIFISFIVNKSTATEEEGRPNILVLISDDHNANTIGCYNGSFNTPGIDRIAREGIKFTRAYTNASLCVPTRYACLTGSYASRCLNPNYGPLERQALIANGSFGVMKLKIMIGLLNHTNKFTK